MHGRNALRFHPSLTIPLRGFSVKFLGDKNCIMLFISIIGKFVLCQENSSQVYWHRKISITIFSDLANLHNIVTFYHIFCILLYHYCLPKWSYLPDCFWFTEIIFSHIWGIFWKKHIHTQCLTATQHVE